MNPEENHDLEWFLNKVKEGWESETSAPTPFHIALRNLVMQYYPNRSAWSTPVPNFWSAYPEAKNEIIISMVCPVVCRGYLDGGENWHQLCLDKADKMMEALNAR